MSQTPALMRELDEASSATHQQQEVAHIEPEIAYTKNATNTVVENSAAQFNSAPNIAQAVRTNISSTPLDRCMLYRKLPENSRSSKRKRTIAAMEQAPVSVREIGETSAQGSSRNQGLKKTKAKNKKITIVASQKKGGQTVYSKKDQSLKEIDIQEDTQITINKCSVIYQRVYNAPTTDEVAAIWPDNTSSSESNGPYITVRGKSTKSHRIYHNYGCYDPLQYPLLFPHGDCGWVRFWPRTVKDSSKQTPLRL
ncbi:uncharacterized protein LOC110690063 isoform X3 [Chenopodium quinoa]|uniref:uncharacterized protein LOC110690063 isoform X3 n=1 Tax=Chenopodium quinoa TaxID=63459 RepID=UPI000B78D9A3|nr:uncharacterized protein LOC110690063 isoform X3 [Chenopodium quinoa]